MKPAWLNPVFEWWHSREPRERGLIGLASAVLMLGALYGWVLDPALQAKQRLKTELPAAQAMLAQVQQLSAAAKLNPSAGNAAPHTQASLQASIAAAGMSATVSAAAPWVVTLSAANGEALWRWLAAHAVSKTQLKRTANSAWQGELVLE